MQLLRGPIMLIMFLHNVNYVFWDKQTFPEVECSMEKLVEVQLSVV